MRIVWGNFPRFLGMNWAQALHSLFRWSSGVRVLGWLRLASVGFGWLGLAWLGLAWLWLASVVCSWYGRLWLALVGPGGLRLATVGFG